jgi:hypothetical protein
MTGGLEGNGRVPGSLLVEHSGHSQATWRFGQQMTSLALPRPADGSHSPWSAGVAQSHQHDRVQRGVGLAATIPAV